MAQGGTSGCESKYVGGYVTGADARTFEFPNVVYFEDGGILGVINVNENILEIRKPAHKIFIMEVSVAYKSFQDEIPHVEC